jgi:hypothetical protein
MGAFAFPGSGCLLVLEIVAGRLAPTLGVWLYTWTSLIGVVLAGGEPRHLCGRADRRPLAVPGRRARTRLRHAFLRVSGDSRFVRYVESLQLSSGAPAIVQVLRLTTVLFVILSRCIAATTSTITRLSPARSARAAVLSEAFIGDRASTSSGSDCSTQLPETWSWFPHACGGCTRAGGLRRSRPMPQPQDSSCKASPARRFIETGRQ